MGDDNVRHECARRVDILAPIFIDVDDEMRGRLLAQSRKVERLGATHFGDGSHAIARMDAEASAGHDVVAQVERKQEFGETGDQAGDARARLGARMRDAGPIDGDAGGQSGCRGLRPEWKKAKSYNGRGTSFKARAAARICQGRT